jgi:hypothetical protein
MGQGRRGDRQDIGSSQELVREACFAKHHCIWHRVFADWSDLFALVLNLDASSSISVFDQRDGMFP